MALDIQMASSPGITPGTPAAKPKDAKLPVLNFGSKKISAKDRMFFTEQLSLMLATGTSLHPALVSIAGQMSNSPMHQTVLDMAEGVMNGRSLSEELSLHPKVFTPVYVNLVAASESGGFLHEVLEQLCQMEEQNAKLRATLVSAFSYPAFLIAFSIFVLVFVLLVVFPKFAELFTAIGDQLPGSTKVLMATSNFLLKQWIWVLAGGAVTIFGLFSWLRTRSGKKFTDQAKLTAPLLGKVWQQVYLVLILRVLGLSIQHGVSLVDAVRTSREVTNNQLIQLFLAQLSNTLEEGNRLAQGVAKASWLPDLAKQMLTTAEESGSLAPVMLRLSEYYNRELDRMLERFSKMIEPIMLVVMGALVGLLVSSMILPIFKLSSAVT